MRTESCFGKTILPMGMALLFIAGCGLALTPCAAEELSMRARVDQYAPVELTADLDHLSANQRKMLPLLIEAAKEMESIFWQQAYGDAAAAAALAVNEDQRRFLEINFGPWDRLGDNRPFIDGVEEKPAGANFYPRDMTKREFEQHLEAHPEDAETFKSLYTVIRRDADGKLTAIPYHSVYAAPTQRAAAKLREAAELADDEGFQKYLLARADALETDDYRPSDLLWMDMKSNAIDFVVGPIENYEDQMFGYKAAHEAYVLIKDQEWSQRLAKYVTLLPELQKGLPVEARYKQEEPGSNSDLNAYDVVYYAGDCNAGSKTIAINLPNDETVQLEKGTRRLQLKNAMRAKFDKIMVPIADTLIVEDQRKHVTFNAFFSNTMFHEVAHGLGIKFTIRDKASVRDALRDLSSSIEEGKADILGLYMVTQLLEDGTLTEGQLEDYYVTFMAGIFRSVRFGASSAHGRANMLRFNFFKDQNAFTREPSGRYRVNMSKMRSAMTALSGRLLELQGDGRYDIAAEFVDEQSVMGPTLKSDLERLNAAGIPVDVVFEQGVESLGL